jgi:cob(I)alamin adenosyltransferase
MTREQKNRVVLITGDGKGKTTSALGMVLRAVGNGLRVCVIHFIKSRKDTGEARALALLQGVEAYTCGAGFVLPTGGLVDDAHTRAAQAGLALAAEKLRDPAFGMVVLDEICGAVALGLVGVQEVREALGSAAPDMVIVLTGRNACRELIEMADTVSSVECVKHGMDKGWPAQKGVEL